MMHGNLSRRAEQGGEDFQPNLASPHSRDTPLLHFVFNSAISVPEGQGDPINTSRLRHLFRIQKGGDPIVTPLVAAEI